MTQPKTTAPAPVAGAGFPPDDVIAGLLRAATLAPSMHNTQPWRFRILRARQEIELYADPARTLRFSDPHGRAGHIACGAALFNLRLAIMVAGREPVARLLPGSAAPPASPSPHTARNRPAGRGPPAQ